MRKGSTSNCPCRYCKPPKRQPACGGTCKEFKEWREERWQEEKAKKDAKSAEAMINEYVLNTLNKIKRKKRTGENLAKNKK